VVERASESLQWFRDIDSSILARALDELTLGRAHFALALTARPLPSLRDSGWQEEEEEMGRAAGYLNRAVELLRQSGNEDELPRGLLARAALRRIQQNTNDALADLDKAEEIAQRGQMRLHECDVHLERARLAVVLGRPDEARERLERARQLVEETGYHRRDEEVEELEAIVRRMPAVVMVESAAEEVKEVKEDIEEPEEKTVSKKHVFLSYCHDDKDAVRKLHDDLVHAGEPVWWDQDILPGQNWKQSIRRAMKDAHAVVVCLSQAIAKRERSGVFPELRDAIGEYRLYPPGSIFLIPVRLDDCDVPDLEIDATTTLNDLQREDLFPPSRRADGLKRLVRALQAASGRTDEGEDLGAVASGEDDHAHEDEKQEKTMSENALKLWREKLDFLRQEEAITASPVTKFDLRKRIEEAEAKIRELGGEVATARKQIEEAEAKIRELSGDPTAAATTGPTDEEVKHVAALAEIKRKRLRVLEMQAAFYGVNAPPHVVLEIDELKTEIEKLVGAPKRPKDRV